MDEAFAFQGLFSVGEGDTICYSKQNPAITQLTKYSPSIASNASYQLSYFFFIPMRRRLCKNRANVNKFCYSKNLLSLDIWTIAQDMYFFSVLFLL